MLYLLESPNWVPVMVQWCSKCIKVSKRNTTAKSTSTTTAHDDGRLSEPKQIFLLNECQKVWVTGNLTIKCQTASALLQISLVRCQLQHTNHTHYRLHNRNVRTTNHQNAVQEHVAPAADSLPAHTDFLLHRGCLIRN